ncbi:MAG TPA: DEAD/DEAH box helicase family protein [Solirubrobacteraceae bacterium]|nr:DEAD/DEAH box helicase family protein [Solirubrobacteraceae bacterium]
MPPSIPPLRAWQRRALNALDAVGERPFLLSAAPGTGKTRPALEHARRLRQAGAVSGVVVLCPTAPLTRQWAAAAAPLGVQLLPDAPDARPPRDFDGVAVTYARVASDPAAWARSVRPGLLLIADEAHHLGEELAWGQSYAHAFAPVVRRLLLSGTPFRSDGTPIPGVSYDSDGVAEPDIAYTYSQAVRDGVCRPVGFITYDGTLSWRSGEDVIESSFADVLSTREAARRYRTAISAELPDGLPRILGEAHERLQEIRADGHRDAAGLVIAADGEHARQLTALLRKVTGAAPVVVLHTEARAPEKLAAFRRSREPWIVAVNMVSEGVDIPRLRLGVYATASKTALAFRQIVGRFVRIAGPEHPGASFLYLPADPTLRRHAGDVEREIAPALRQLGEEDPLDEREALERAAPVRDEELAAFQPLSADVAPQLTLFGGPAPAPSAPAGATSVAELERAPSTHERRELLRDKRRRLVADLSRASGRSHSELNRWLNDSVGVARVQDASIEQLERAIDLLFRRLSSRPRR